MSIRDITKALFKVILAKSDWVLLPTDEQNAILRRIERSCWNETISRAKAANVNRTFDDPSFAGIYADITYMVSVHLDPQSTINSQYEDANLFVRQILDGTIDAEAVATCSYEQMRPEVNRKIRDDIDAKMNVKDEMKVSYEYTCKNCGHGETTYNIGQVRGSDESATKFVKCNKCYTQWRIG